MSQSFATDQGLLVVPGSYASYTVKAENVGLGTTGVIMLVGEAEAGPSFSQEGLKLKDNAFGPDQEGDIVSRYGSGPLVDAFRAAVAASADPRVTGSVSRIVMVKTNTGARASAELERFNATTYGFLAARNYGKSGNLINYIVDQKTAEVRPTTGAFTYIPAVGTVAYNIRANGGAAVGGTLGANTAPNTFVTTLDALAGILATGGANLAVHPASGNISVTAAANVVTVTTTVALGATPAVGSTLVIPDGSVIEGASNQNVGAYVVTAATSTTIVATKLSDAGKPGATPGTITAPVTVASLALSGTPANDVQAFGSVTITIDAADPIDGVGKSLEVAELTTGTDLLSRALKLLGTTTDATWISKTTAPQVLASATEYSVSMTVARQLDDVEQDFVAGGEIALKIGYEGTTATVTVSDTTLTVARAGGSGADVSLSLKDYPTVGDLATFINTLTGYTASVGNGILGQLPSTALDDVATGCASTHKAATGRLKVDAYKLFKKLSDSLLVGLADEDGDVMQATSGLPAPTTNIAFLAGGTKGSTSGANVADAITALEKVRGNFLVPCFSRNASEDVVDGLTESASTYTIDAINAAAKTHAIKCSQLKNRRNRQALLSIRGTFEAAKAAASNTAFFRCVMCFQDVKDLASSGTIVQFQPYLAAAKAAGMQAAGFYRSIVGKAVNCSGVIQAAGDYDDSSLTDPEDALLAGLLPLKREEDGGFTFVSDQTTYGKDNNFVFNSLQAVYMADTLALGLSQSMEKDFKGENLSDVPASVILASLDAKLAEYKRLKVITASDDAPAGYKNAKIKINGNAALISFEGKINGALLFLPINFTISAVRQEAG